MAKIPLFTDSVYFEAIKNLDLDNYIIELLNESIKNKNTDKRSNVNGIQTNNILNEKLIGFFNLSIKNALDSFGIKNSTSKFVYAWINKNYKNSYNNVHIHPGCHFVMVYYCKTPEDSGSLVFRRNDQTVELQMYDEHFNTTDSFNKFEIKPKKGLFIIFPAHLQHYVNINNTQEDRISLSCNIRLINNG